MTPPELPHPGHALHQAHGGLGKQLGPFPVGVWLLIIVGGLGIAWYSRNHASTPAASDPLAGASPSPADLTSGGLDSSGGAGQLGDGTGSGSDGQPPQIVIVVPPPPAPHPTTTPSGGVTTPVKKPAPHPTVKSPAAAYYVVRSGDTLTSIAHRYHTTATHLYTLNRTLIENTARRHGKANSGHGHWIWPGERLRVK